MAALRDLAPRWVAQFGAPADAKQGISFLCPHCRTQRLATFFSPPIAGPCADIKQVHRDQSEPGHLADEHVGRIIWTRVSGDTFDDLTLTPSIDASAWGCWHGHVTNGQAT